MSDINNEIEQVAGELEKSNKTPKEVLFETIRTLGAEGVRAKLPTLEKSEQELLLSALQEMKKANSMDAEYQAKFVQGKITDTKIQEDKADDDQDEKLVKPENATISHQGTPTPGWEGQVIKGKEMSKDAAKDKLMQMEEKEHGTKDPKKLVEAETKEHKMKKGEQMDEQLKDAKKKVKSGDKDKMKEGLKEMKKALELKMPEASPELIKGEMKKLLAEEDQDGDAPEMNEATRAKKENVPALDLGKDNKKNMTKSAVWGGENDLLKAMTQGRNHHFSMDEYIDAVLTSAAKPAEEIKKSNPAKEDLNDVIAKGGDRKSGHFETEELMKENKKKQNGKVTKSFADNEIAQALGLTEEEAKKILGE